MDKKHQRNNLEEYGMELGDVNAIKYYELQAGNKEDKHKKKKDKEKS